MKEIGKIILVLAVCLAVSCIKEKPAGADLGVGDRIPDFAVTMNDGTRVSGEYLREGISFIMFFSTACPDCQKALPLVQKIYEEYAHQGVLFALISREEAARPVEEFWNAKGLTMPYSAQEDSTVYELFARTRVPRIYINEDGIIKAVFTDDPVPEYDDLKAALDGILALGRYQESSRSFCAFEKGLRLRKNRTFFEKQQC